MYEMKGWLWYQDKVITRLWNTRQEALAPILALMEKQLCDLGQVSEPA